LELALFIKQSGITNTMRNLITCALFALTIVIMQGCQNMPANQIQKAMADVSQCTKDIAEYPATKSFYSDIFFLKDDSPNKFDLLSSSNRLSDQQKSTMKEYLTLSAKCRGVSIQGLSGLPQQASIINFYNSLDVIYLRLIKDEITIGEANQLRVKATSEMRENFIKTTEAVNQAEAQRAALLMPFLLQQQQIQANQQQQLYQQQMQIINNNKVYNTNCTSIGSSTNCTTR
jgi:hypothetical protein